MRKKFLVKQKYLIILKIIKNEKFEKFEFS